MALQYKKSPAKPSKTPASFFNENSFLYSENNRRAVNIGTVACSMDKDPAPSFKDA